MGVTVHPFISKHLPLPLVSRLFGEVSLHCQCVEVSVLTLPSA